MLERRPVVDVFVASRVAGRRPVGVASRRPGLGLRARRRAAGDVLRGRQHLAGLRRCPTPSTAFATQARRHNRRCASIVGLASEVLPMWEQLRRSWGPPRELRDDQPLLVLDRPPLVTPDPQVRLVQPVGTGRAAAGRGGDVHRRDRGPARERRPLPGAGGRADRARRCFARIENGRVLFKAEVGAATRPPARSRASGWPRPCAGRVSGPIGTAAVAAAAQRDIAPIVSLYVNAFNVSARRAYDRVGFTRLDTFASVLF